MPREFAHGAIGPGLVWGLAFGPEGTREVDHCGVRPAEGFRWLHLNLVQQGTRDWIEQEAGLPPGVREVLLSTDTHQRAVVEGEALGCVIHDFERDFAENDTGRVGAIRIAVAPGLFLTARTHPIRSADLVRQRISAGVIPPDAGAALDLLVGAICQNISDMIHRLSEELRLHEDAFLEGREPPANRELMKLRRRLARIHRLLEGLHGVFRRLEHDDELSPALLPVAEKLSQRLSSLDRDALSAQGQLRLLREEIDIQTTQRTNQNLYILSIMTALLLPATLVTGIFGMNTGDLPFTGDHGTLVATLVAGGAAGLAYALLRWLGFMRM